jgi:hypothetical protein
MLGQHRDSTYLFSLIDEALAVLQALIKPGRTVVRLVILFSALTPPRRRPK